MNILSLGKHQTNPRLVTHRGVLDHLLLGNKSAQGLTTMVDEHWFNHTVHVTVPPCFESYELLDETANIKDTYLAKIASKIEESGALGSSFRMYHLKCSLLDLLKSLRYEDQQITPTTVVMSTNTHLDSQHTISIYNGTLHITMDRESYQTFGLVSTFLFLYVFYPLNFAIVLYLLKTPLITLSIFIYVLSLQLRHSNPHSEYDSFEPSI